MTARRATPAGVAASDSRPAEESLLYLYAVIEADAPAGALLRDGRVAGLVDDAPLFGIARGGLVAAVSQVPTARFNAAAIDALAADLSRLAPVALRHEEAIRALRPVADALVPLAFGAVYREPAGVVSFLEERAGLLRATLDRVRRRDEWGIKVFRETVAFRAFVEATSEPLRQLDAELRDATPGRAYLLGKQRERRVQDEVERESDRATAAIFQRLASLAVEARRDALPSGALASPRPLLLKGALLVEREATADLEARSTELADAASARGLVVELTGPWAAYSFVGPRP